MYIQHNKITQGKSTRKLNSSGTEEFPYHTQELHQLLSTSTRIAKTARKPEEDARHRALRTRSMNETTPKRQPSHNSKRATSKKSFLLRNNPIHGTNPRLSPLATQSTSTKRAKLNHKHLSNRYSRLLHEIRIAILSTAPLPAPGTKRRLKRINL